MQYHTDRIANNMAFGKRVAGKRNSSVGPSWGIELTTPSHHDQTLYHPATSRSFSVIDDICDRTCHKVLFYVANNVL